MSEAPSLANIGEALSYITARFKAKGMEEPKRQAEDLLCDLLDCGRAELYQRLFTHVERRGGHSYCAWVERRLQGEPLALHIWQNELLRVPGLRNQPNVLIPRQETELLVDKIAKVLQREEIEGKILMGSLLRIGLHRHCLKEGLPYVNGFVV